MTPTEKQKTLSEQSVYGDLMVIDRDNEIWTYAGLGLSELVEGDCALYDENDNARYDWIDEIKPILRPLDLTKEITHRGYNNDQPFIPLVELAKIASSEYKDAEIVDFNELTKTVEFYCNDARDSEVELRKFFYINSGAFIVEDSRVGDFDIIDHNTYMKMIDLLNLLHFDIRGLIPSSEAISTDEVNLYEVNRK